MSDGSEDDQISKGYIHLITKMKTNKHHFLRTKRSSLDNFLAKSEDLFKKVRKPDTLKLDARFMLESTQIQSSNLEKDLRTTEIDTDAFIEYLETSPDKIEFYLANLYRNWHGVSFFNMLYLKDDDEITARRVINRTARSEIPELEVTKKMEETKEVDNSVNISKKIRSVVVEKGSVDYFTLVIDPVSYSKTIENMFYLAFSIRLGMVFLEFKDGNLCVVKRKSQARKEKEHLIMSIEYSEYKRIIKNLNITEAMI